MVKQYRFVAGQEVITTKAHSVLDAWLSVERLNERGILPSEFKTEVIEAYDSLGVVIKSARFFGWHDAMMADTYGENWKEVIYSADQLTK